MLEKGENMTFFRPPKCSIKIPEYVSHFSEFPASDEIAHLL